jgi:hypothetical protein
MGKSGSIFRFIAILAAVLLLGILFVSPFQEGFGWTVSTQAGTGVFVATGTYVITTTDQFGNVFTSTMTGTYLTTSQTTSGTVTACVSGYVLVGGNCVKPGAAYLTLTLHGTTTLLDKDGNALSTSTIEIVPATGGAAASKYGFTLDANVEGVGIQWDTLQVIVSIGGVVGQPSLTDANKADIVNDAGAIKHVQSNQKTSHVTGDVTIDQLLGGRNWDHGRYLMPALGIVASATARVDPLYTYELAGVPQDTIGIITSPVVSLASLKWYQPLTPTPTQTQAVTTERPQTQAVTTERPEPRTTEPRTTEPRSIELPPPPPPPPPPSVPTRQEVVVEAGRAVREAALHRVKDIFGTATTEPERTVRVVKVEVVKSTGGLIRKELLGAPSLIQIWREVGSNVELGSSGRFPMFLVSITLMVVAVVWVLSDRNAKKRFKHLSAWF